MTIVWAFIGMIAFFILFGALMIFGVREPRVEITSREVYGFHRKAVR